MEKHNHLLTFTGPERRFLEGRMLELRPRSQAEWDEFWTHTLNELKERIERDVGESDRLLDSMEE